MVWTERLWALAQRIRASQGQKLEKSLTKARTKENEHMARWYGPNLDVSLCCGPNGCPKAAPNVSRAIASPLGAGRTDLRLICGKASKSTTEARMKENEHMAR